MKRFGLIAVTAFFVLLSVPRIAAQQVTVNVNIYGQPASGMSVVFLAANLIKSPTAEPGQPRASDANALNLGNMLKTRTATTNPSGTAVLDLSNIIKPHGQSEVQIVVRICKDGKNVVYILQQGQQVPPQDEKCVNNTDCKCKDRSAGIFLITDGDTINVSVNPESIDVHITHIGPEASAELKESTQIVSFEVGGGVGFKNLGGTKGEILPGGTFSTPSPTSFSGDVSARLNVGPVSFATNFYAANGISSKGDTSLPSGGSDIVSVNRTFRGDTLTV